MKTKDAVSSLSSNDKGPSTLGPLTRRVRTVFSPRVDVTLDCGPGLTQQSFAPECDINTILKRYGVNAMGTNPPEVFRDISSSYDILDAFNLVDSALAHFYDLPADARRALNDDPRRLLELSSTPQGIELLRSYGFVDGLQAKPTLQASPDALEAQPPEGSQGPKGGQ